MLGGGGGGGGGQGCGHTLTDSLCRCDVSTWYPRQPSPVFRPHPHTNQLHPGLAGTLAELWGHLLHLPPSPPLHAGHHHVSYGEESVQHAVQYSSCAGLPRGALWNRLQSMMCRSCSLSVSWTRSVDSHCETTPTGLKTLHLI